MWSVTSLNSPKSLAIGMSAKPPVGVVGPPGYGESVRAALPMEKTILPPFYQFLRGYDFCGFDVKLGRSVSRDSQ